MIAEATTGIRSFTRVPLVSRCLAVGAGWGWDDVRDLSEQGMRVSSRQALPVGTKTTFHLRLPKTDKTVEVEGTVMWSDPSSFGVRFHGVDFAVAYAVQAARKERTRI